MAKRVNKRFLMVLSVAVVGGGVAALLISYLARPNPANLIIEGNGHWEAARKYAQEVGFASTQPTSELTAKVMMQRKALTDAADCYQRALRMAPANAEVRLRLGDVYHELVRFDPQLRNGDMREWERVLEVKPSHVPALQRLLDEQIVRAQLSKQADGFQEAARRASRLASAEPTDARAQAWQHIGTIMAWLIAGGTDAGIPGEIEAIRPMLVRPPAKPKWPADDPYQPAPMESSLIADTIAGASLKMAREQETSDPAASERLAENALAAYETAIAAQPNDALLWLRYYQFQRLGETVIQRPMMTRAQRLAALLSASVARWCPSPAAAVPSIGGVAPVREVMPIAALQSAVANVKPDDATYTDVSLAAARARMARGESDEARELLRRLLSDRPADMTARSGAATMLSMMGRYEDAITELKKPLPIDPAAKGVRALVQERLETNRRIALATARLDQYAAAWQSEGRRPSAEERANLEAELRAEIQQLSQTTVAEQPELLALRARMLVILPANGPLTLDGRSRQEAIALLRKAVDSLAARRGLEYGWTKLLIGLLQSERMSGDAKGYLAKLVSAFPTDVQAQLDLANLLLIEGQTDQAERQLNDAQRTLNLLANVQDPTRQSLVQRATDLRLAIMAANNVPRGEICKRILTGLPVDEILLTKPNRPVLQMSDQERRRLLDATLELPDAQRRELAGAAKLLSETERQKLLRAAGLLLAQNAPDWAMLILLPLSELERSSMGTVQPSTQPAFRETYPASLLLVLAYLADEKLTDGRQRAHELARQLATAEGTYEWKMRELQLRDKPDPEEVARLFEDQIKSVKDEARREWLRYQRLTHAGKTDDAAKALMNAEQAGEGQLATLEKELSAAAPNSVQAERAKASLAAARQRMCGVLEVRFTQTTAAKDWAAAQKYAGRLGELDNHESGPLYWKARLELARGPDDRAQNEAALADAGTLVSQAPDLARSWVMLGWAQQTMQRFDQAIRSYNRALEKDLTNDLALRGLVQCSMALNHADQAKQYIDRATRSLQGSEWFQAMRLELREKEDPATATADREKEWQRNKSMTALGALVRNYTLLALREPAKARNHITAAIQRVEEALKLWPDEAALYDWLATLIWDQSGDLEKALWAVDRFAAQPKWKDSPQPHLLRARTYTVAGKLDEAEAAYRSAITQAQQEKDPLVGIECRQQLGEFYLGTQKWAEGIAILQKLFDETRRVDIGERVIELLLEKALAEADRDPAKAEATARQASAIAREALEARPGDPDLLCLLSRAQWNDLESARKCLEEALRARPNYWRALFYRGLYKLNESRVIAQKALVDRRELTRDERARVDALESSGMEDLEKARSTAPAPNVLLNRTLAARYERDGRTDDAIAALQEALSASPQAVSLRQELVRMCSAQRRWADVQRLIEEAQIDPQLSRQPAWWYAEAVMWNMRGRQRNVDMATARAKELSAIRTAQGKLKKLPQPNPVLEEQLELQYIQLLSEGRQYNELLKETEDIGKPGKDSWWRYAARSTALANTNRRTEAEKTAETAMSVMDSGPSGWADHWAQSLARSIWEDLGTEWTETRLLARKNIRWHIQWAGICHQLAVIASEPSGAWKKACAVADALMDVLRREQELVSAGKLTAITPSQRIAALNRAGDIYSSAYKAAAGAMPETADKAEKAYAAIADMAGVDPLSRLYALNNLAYFLAERPIKPDPARAVEYSTQAYELMKKSQYVSGVADTHGWALAKAGRLDEAIKVLNEVVLRGDAPLAAHVHLAQALFDKGRVAEARDELALVRDLMKRPENESEAKALENQVKALGAKIDPASTQPASTRPAM